LKIISKATDFYTPFKTKFGLLAMWFLVRIYFFNLTNHKKEMLATAMMKSVAFEIIFNDVLGQSN
jgi:hypothetical protein